MPVTPDEAAEMARQVAELATFLTAALRRDATGRSRLDRTEGRELLRRLTALGALVARDVLD
jgi:hypothetical protein